MSDEDNNDDQDDQDDQEDQEDQEEQDALLRRILREEALVTDGELRVEVARVLQRSVTGDEDVKLYEKKISTRGAWSMTRASRSQTVEADYRQRTARTEILMFDGSYTETVEGGVYQNASVEAEHIVGGAYTGNWFGPILRTVAFCDFLAWGGWADADATRIEIAGLSIRAYMGYAHAAALRVIKAGALIDDWQARTETFGTFVDNQTDAILLGGGPSGGKELHA